MARRNYLVEGLSGAGKSSVYEELIRRGYKAVSTDRAWKRRDGADSIWDEQMARVELESIEPDVLFVCGSSSNRDLFLPYFTKIFNLRIDDDTMRRRLAERTNNDFGKQPEELELMLGLNRSGEKPNGAVDVDATQPLGEVVEEVLRLADCRPVNGNPKPPWYRGAAGAESFVVPGSALGHDLRRESTAHIEYAWSGSVLEVLLPCLAEQGIDLVPSPRGGPHVLTWDHRERYLARLDPSEFDGPVLRRYYEELEQTEAAGVEYALLDGIAFFRDTLEPLEPGLVAVLTIG